MLRSLSYLKKRKSISDQLTRRKCHGRKETVENHRCFVAIFPPNDVLLKITQTQAQLQHIHNHNLNTSGKVHFYWNTASNHWKIARWVGRQHLHFTLRFFAELSSKEVDNVKNHLTSIARSISPFKVGCICSDVLSLTIDFIQRSELVSKPQETPCGISCYRALNSSLHQMWMGTKTGHEEMKSIVHTLENALLRSNLVDSLEAVLLNSLELWTTHFILRQAMWRSFNHI